MNTAVHISILNGNWSLAIHIGNKIGYYLHYKNFRKNQSGLNEYELALVLYGIHGHRKEIEAVFGYEGSVWNKFATFESGFSELKSIIKSIKIIKKNNNKYFLLNKDHALFRLAIEDEYPSCYASFEDENSLALFEREK